MVGEGAEHPTRAEVEVMLNQWFRQYERDIAAPRHKDNTRKIDRLSWIMGIGVGIVITLNAVVLGRLH